MTAVTEVASNAGEARLRLEEVCVEAVGHRGENRLILDRVGFDVDAGEVLGVVGETGSGKSVTARAILGVLPPALRRTGGRVTFRGAELTAGRRGTLRRVRGTGLAFVPQDLRGALHPTLSVGRQFAILVGKHHDVGRADIAARAKQCLADCGIRDVDRVMKSYSHELSGGMAQRVAIALTMALEAEVLIADEPTTGCDTTVQRQILDVLVDRVRTRHSALVLITHDLGVVGTYCDRTVVMHDGCVVESGATRCVLDTPADPYTQNLVAAARASVRLEADIHPQRVEEVQGGR